MTEIIDNIIYVASNEPSTIKDEFSLQWSTNPKLAQFQLQFSELPCSDMCFRSLCAERKAIADMVASIHDGRIFRQSFEMYHNFEHKYIFLVGNIDSLEKRDWKGIYTTIADAECRYGFKTLMFPTSEMMVHYFLMLCNKLSRNLKPKWRWTKPSITSDDELECMMEGIYGVGHKNAVKLLNAFGSIHNLTRATETSIRSVRGIPIKLAEHIFSLLKQKYEGKQHNETEN